MAKKKKKLKVEAVQSGDSTVLMQYEKTADAKEVRAISIAGTTYTKRSDGRFLVMGEHVPALKHQGLIPVR